MGAEAGFQRDFFGLNVGIELDRSNSIELKTLLRSVMF